MSTVRDVVKKTKSNKAEEAKQALIKFVDIFNKEFELYFDQELRSPFGINTEETKLSRQILQHIKELSFRPNKRLRASFVYYSYKLLGGKSKNILKAAMGIELIHTALLIHDDFMDQDEIRRGGPTTHKYFEGIHQQSRYRGSSVHFGNSMAINTGDVALMLASELLGNTGFDKSRQTLASNTILRGIANTALGQAYDVTLEAKGSTKEQDVIDLHHAKTAIYTYLNPLTAGAIFAGATKSDLKLIKRYAIPGGIAFQLQDDVLGMFGDTKKTGKSAYADLKEGKVTLLTVYVLNNGSEKQVRRYKEIWGNKSISKREANEARKIVVDTGSLDHSRKVSIKWAQKAQGAIPEMRKRKWNKEAIDYLDGIAQYMIERDL